MSSASTIFPANRLAPLRGIRCRELLRLHRPQYAQHLVQFYQDESFIIDNTSFLAAQTLVSGDSSVIVATEPRLSRIGERIAACGLNLNVLQTLGRYVAVDATEALTQFMIDAQPDEKKFDQVIGGILRGVESNSEHGFVFVFGEMVELLCAAKKPAAAVQLEKFWNALAARNHFSLYCAYSLSSLGDVPDADTLMQICAEHSLTIPTETPI
jgi:MEDS: MEthanogen/methylotroph, DcmR Sensory domain